MRSLLTLCGVGIVFAAAWTVTAGARASGHGHGSHSHGGLEGHMRRVAGGHFRGGGMIFPTQLDEQLSLFRTEPEPGPVAPGMPTAGVVAGEPEHKMAGHLMGPAGHAHFHAPLRVEGGEPRIPQPVAPRAAEAGEGETATAQPAPGANPWSARPPGAAGPGQPVSSRPSPGLPGPGRPASPPG